LNGTLLTSVEARDQLTARVVTDLTTTITVETAGGGGYGDPHRRDPRAVLRDVRNGLVTVKTARDVYGLNIDPTTLTAVPTDDANKSGDDRPPKGGQ
jgi:N-methylhydantoinase B